MDHLEARVDIQALSRTCHALHCLTRCPALEAAWLWRWHGNQALFRLPVRALSVPVLRQLVEVHHADINAQLEATGYGPAVSLLHLACQLDRTEVVEFLISAPGINVNLAFEEEGLKVTPLHAACMAAGPSIRALRQLLAVPQIQVNASLSQGLSSLYMACITNRVAVVEELLRHPDVDVNLMADVRSPLAAAATAGHSAIVAMLLQHPAIQVNAFSMLPGVTPLYLASTMGLAQVVRELLRHPDVQVNLHGPHGHTTLRAACDNGHLDVIRELLEHPALDAGSIRATLTAAEGRGQGAVVALLRGSRAGRRALRGQGGA